MIYFIYATESGAAWSTRTRIWESDRVDVTTESNYYPIIYDGQCNLEMGKAGTLKFTVAPDHPYYSQFRKKKTILTVIQIDAAPGSKWADISSEVNGSNCIFRGAVDEISVDVFQQATISATDLLISLEDSLHVPSGKSKVKKTRRAWFEQALADHNSQMTSEPEKKFTLGTVDSFQGKAANENEISDTSYTETMSFIKSNVMDQCNGYLRVRYSDNFATHYLDLVETYGTTASQQFKFAVNIADVSHEDISDDLYTVLVPVGKNAKTIEGASGTRTTKYLDMDGTWKNVTVRINGKYIEIPDAIASYGYIYSPVSFSDKDSVDDIISESLKHISSTYHADNFTLSVKAIDMNHLDSNQKIVHLGDKITVIRYSKVNQDGSLVDRRVNAMCSAINYDLISPENTEYTIGTNFENMTKGGGSSGGGGGSSGGGGGGYGGFNECIGHMVGDMAVIDHAVTQINGDLLEVNTSITRINSEVIDLAGRVKITEDFINTTYADNTSIINWTYNNVQNWDGTFGEMYEQWIEFTGSQVYQTQDQWSSFVGLWYATYGPNGEFLGFVYRDGGGLFVEEDGVRVGLFKEGDLTGGMVVEALEDGTVTTKIRGDLIDITANNILNLMVQSLVDDSDLNNPKMDYSGISIGRNQVSFGFYEASGTGPQELSAGILVNKLSDGSTTTKIKSTYIDFEGIVNAQYINSLFSKNNMFQADVASINQLGVRENYFFIGSQMYNILESGHSIMDAVIAFDQDNITTTNNQVSIPYKTLGNASTWKYLTFKHVTSVTGNWSGNAYSVIAGDTTPISFTVGARFQNVPGAGFGYAIEAYRIEKNSSNSISIGSTQVYYKLGLTGDKEDTKVVIQYADSGNTIPSTDSYDVGTLFTDGRNSATVTGSWDGASFNYGVEGNYNATKKQTSVTLRYGYTATDGSGTWITDGWTTKSNGQWITNAQAVDPSGKQISLKEINANSVFNEGLKAATVDGQWTGLTFNYWNTSNKSKTTKPTTISVQYGFASSGGWQPNQWTTVDGDKVTYIGVFNGNTLLNSATKIKAPTQGLYINSGTGAIEISSSSAETLVPITAEASISYNASTHTYTATGKAKASSTTMSTSTRSGGSEAYNAGINAGSVRITLTNGGSRSSISSGINLASYGTVYEIDANYMMANGTLSNSVTHLYVKTPSDRYHSGWNAGGNAAAFTMGPTSSYMQNITALPYSTTYIVYAYYMTHDSSTGADAGTSMCSQGLMYFNTPSDRYHTGWNAGGNAAAFTIGPYGYYVQSAATLAYNTTYIMYAYYTVHDSSTGAVLGTSMCSQGSMYFNTPIDTGSTAKFVFTEAAYDGVSPSYTLEIGKKYLCYPYYTSANGQTYETPGRQYYYINPPTSNQYYTGGWNAARSALSYPPSQDYASTHHSRAVFRIPASTVDASGAKNYYLALSSALSGNTLTVHAALYSGATANGITVALQSATFTTPAAPGYTSGWRSAYSMVSWPAKQNFSSTYYTRAVFYYPSYTVDQSRSSAYWLAMSSSIENGIFWAYASLHAGTITGNVVALNRLSYKIPDAPTVTISYTQQSASQSPGGLAPTTSAIKLNKYTTPNTYNYLKITAGGKTQWFYY